MNGMASIHATIKLIPFRSGVLFWGELQTLKAVWNESNTKWSNKFELFQRQFNSQRFKPVEPNQWLCKLVVFKGNSNLNVFSESRKASWKTSNFEIASAPVRSFVLINSQPKKTVINFLEKLYCCLGCFPPPPTGYPPT